MRFDREAVSNEPPPRSQQAEMQPAWNRSTAEWTSSPTGQYSLFPAERAQSEPTRPSVGERSTPGRSYGQQPNRRRASTAAAPAQLADEEAREALKLFRAERLRKEETFFGTVRPEKDKGTIAVTKGESENEFGVSSKLSPYTGEDRAEANRLRDTLRQKYPKLTKHLNIGEKPNDVPYHAETTLLTRLARKNGGSLVGRTLVAHTDREMCPGCEKLLPKIGLELGNPTVTFIDGEGRRLTMRDGEWL
jgi:hypothetical protein